MGTNGRLVFAEKTSNRDPQLIGAYAIEVSDLLLLADLIKAQIAAAGITVTRKDDRAE